MDACYVPFISTEVQAVNASSVAAAQAMLSPLCTQRFCCSPAAAQQPRSEPPGLGILPEELTAPFTAPQPAVLLLPPEASDLGVVPQMPSPVGAPQAAMQQVRASLLEPGS